MTGFSLLEYSIDTMARRRMFFAKTLTLEYWLDDAWYVSRLREVPGVFSQGKTLEALEENIRDAYALILKEQPAVRQRTRSKPIAISA